MSTFTKPLKLEYIDGKEWKLTNAFVYYTDLPVKYKAFTIPSGFITDFATIPKILCFVFDRFGKYGKAAVLHDYLYSQCPVSRDTADDMFLEAMKVLGVNKTRRYLIYFAVRLFGKKHYCKK